MDELQLNEAFGEMAIFPGEVSPVTAIALEDVEVVVIPAEKIVEAIESNNKFASGFIQYIEERKKMVLVAKGIKDSLISKNSRQVRVRG